MIRLIQAIAFLVFGVATFLVVGVIMALLHSLIKG